EPNSPFYNIPESLAFEGQIDVEVLERALGEIIRRHESLRTSFHNEAGEARQVIAEAVTFRIRLIDVSELAVEERDEETKRLVDDNAQQLLQLGSAPLFRAVVVRQDELRHVLMTSINHIVSDGWSNGILKKELVMLYDAFRKGEASPLKELSIQY